MKPNCNNGPNNKIFQMRQVRQINRRQKLGSKQHKMCDWDKTTIPVTDLKQKHFTLLVIKYSGKSKYMILRRLLF